MNKAQLKAELRRLLGLIELTRNECRKIYEDERPFDPLRADRMMAAVDSLAERSREKLEPTPGR